MKSHLKFKLITLLLCLPIMTSLSLHAKETSDFQVFVDDLENLLLDEQLIDEINNNKELIENNQSNKTNQPYSSEKSKEIKKAEPDTPAKKQNTPIQPKTPTPPEKPEKPNQPEAPSQPDLSKEENKDTKQAYWKKLHFIESSAGKKLYRKRNKAKSCKWTTTPCGHHQLSVQALKDIGCRSLKCRSARENYTKSLSMSKKLEKINDTRMKKKGYVALSGYQRYLVHQQGAYGLGKILDALKGKKKLSKKTLRYMANNSPYSFTQLKRSGHRGAARKFLRYWKKKWNTTTKNRVASR